jgi:tRNA pseudouridine38/39 synthase
MAYQKLNDHNTVEAFIFKALHTMSLVKSPLPSDDYTRAGRTDKGVSAMGNVIALRLRSNTPSSPEPSPSQHPHKKIEYCAMLNAILPEDIRVLACQEVNDEFNARYHCTRRCYKYFFAKNNLNIEAMRDAIKDFVGTHNFINYCKMNLTNTVNF